MALAQKKLNSGMVEANSSIVEEDEWHRAGTHEVYAGDYDFQDDGDDPEEWEVSPPPFFVGVRNAFLISMVGVLAFLTGLYAVIYIAARLGGGNNGIRSKDNSRQRCPQRASARDVSSNTAPHSIGRDKSYPMKKCGICKVVLPLGDFGKWASQADGLKTYCKKCIASKKRATRIEKGLKVRKIAPALASGEVFCSLCEKVMLISQFRSGDVKRNASRGWCKGCVNSYQMDKAHAIGVKLKRKRDPHLLELGLRECFNCDKNLPFSDFSPSLRGYIGLTPYCKPCLSLLAMRDKPSHAAKVRKWRTNNPGNYRIQYIVSAHRRRAIKLGLDSGVVTSAFMKSIYEQILCVYCGRDVPRKERTADHVVPLNKGGLHHPSNLVMCCGSCNSSKGATDLTVFLERRKTRGL